MRPTGCQVEVRKGAGSSTWYNATVVDIVGGNIRVEYEGEVWPSKEVPADSVRHCPPANADADFNPKANDVIEVAIAPTESNPGGWARGTVKQIKNRVFYFVTFEGLSRASQDLIVERDALRPVNESPPIDATNMVRKLIAVDKALASWIRSEDSVGCLTDVALKAKLLSAAPSSQKGPPKVSVVGSQQAVSLAERLLVEIHFKNQIQMQRFQEHREKLREIIEQREQRHSGGCREVFEVESGLVGRLIGKKGENISRIREELEVEVMIRDRDDNAVVTISGADQASVKQAREQLEYVSARIPVEEDKVGWVVGKGHQNLQDICKKADLAYARFDSRSSCIELMGLRPAVEDAKMMIDVHQEYLEVYQDMSDERAAIQQQFQELEQKSGKGKGKKGGFGGDKGYGKGGDKGYGKQALPRGDRGKGGRYEDDEDYYRGPSKGGKGSYGGYDDEEPRGKGKGKGKGKDAEKGGGKDTDKGGKGGKKGGKSKGKGKE